MVTSNKTVLQQQRIVATTKYTVFIFPFSYLVWCPQRTISTFLVCVTVLFIDPPSKICNNGARHWPGEFSSETQFVDMRRCIKTYLPHNSHADTSFLPPPIEGPFFFRSHFHYSPQDIYNQDGVLLRKASLDHREEFNTTGCLYLIEFCTPGSSSNKRRYAIEWRPNDGFLISSTDTQEQDEWSFVDTIAKRNRTTSECLIFDTATNNISVRPSSTANGTVTETKEEGAPKQQQQPTTTTTKRNRNIRVNLNDLKRVDVQRNGQEVRLIEKSTGKVHSEYWFQHGNADNLVRCLCSFYLLTRVAAERMRTVYEVTADETQDKLRKTFAELEIDDIKSPSTGWISNMVSS